MLQRYVFDLKHGPLALLAHERDESRTNYFPVEDVKAHLDELHKNYFNCLLPVVLERIVRCGFGLKPNWASILKGAEVTIEELYEASQRTDDQLEEWCKVIHARCLRISRVALFAEAEAFTRCSYSNVDARKASELIQRLLVQGVK